FTLPQSDPPSSCTDRRHFPHFHIFKFPHFHIFKFSNSLFRGLTLFRRVPTASFPHFHISTFSNFQIHPPLTQKKGESHASALFSISWILSFQLKTVHFFHRQSQGFGY